MKLAVLMFAALPLMAQTVVGPRVYPNGTSDPATCTVGQWFMRTDLTSIKICPATNTWVSIAGGGGAATYTNTNLAVVTTGTVVTHNLGTVVPVVSILDHATSAWAAIPWVATTSNSITVTPGVNTTIDIIVSTGGIGPAGPTGPVSPGGSVLSYATNHTLVSGDCGNWLAMNGTSITLTLANPPTSTTCSFAVQNLAATSLTIARNSLTINGSASNVTLAAASGVTAVELSCWTDGSNYFCSQGPPGSTGATGATGATGPPGSGSIASTTNALKGDGAGAGLAVTGTATDCVLVNGSSGPCGSGSGKIDYQQATSTITGNNTIYSTSIPGGTIPAGACIRAGVATKAISTVSTPLFDICFGSTCVGGMYVQPASGWNIAMEFEVCNDVGSTTAQHINAYPVTMSHGGDPTVVAGFDGPVATPAENTASAVTLLVKMISGGGSDTMKGWWWHVWGPM